MVFTMENQERRPYIGKIKQAIIKVYLKFPKESDEHSLNLSRETLVKYAGEIERKFYNAFEKDGDKGRYQESVQACIKHFDQGIKKLPDDVNWWKQGLHQFTSYPNDPTSAPKSSSPEVSDSATTIKVAPEEPSVPVLSSPKSSTSSSPPQPTGVSSPGPALPAPGTSSPLLTASRPIGSEVSPPKPSAPSPPAGLNFTSILKLASAGAPDLPSLTPPPASPPKPEAVVRPKASPSPANGIKTLMSLMMEEKAARVQAETKQTQMQESILQRLTALEEGSRSRHTETADARAKELAERKAAVSSREGAIEVREEQLQADKAQAKKTADELVEQKKAQDAKDKELSEREAKIAAREKDYADKIDLLVAKDKAHRETVARVQAKIDAFEQQKTAAKPIAAKPVVEAKKAADNVPLISSRELAKEKVKLLTERFPTNKAIIKMNQLEKGRLCASIKGLKAVSLHLEMEAVLEVFGVSPSRRKQHATMLIDLLNFGKDITSTTTTDSPFQNLSPAVKTTATTFADSLTSSVFTKRNWRKYDVVCSQHQILALIKTINRLQNSRFMMDLDLAQTAVVDDEFDDDEPAEPADIVKKYYAQFKDYMHALHSLVLSTPSETPAYATLAQHETCEVPMLQAALETACAAYNVALE